MDKDQRLILPSGDRYLMLSYIITTAGVSLSIYEMMVLVFVILRLNEFLPGEDAFPDSPTSALSEAQRRVILRVSDIPRGKENRKRISAALSSLTDKVVVLDDTSYMGIIEDLDPFKNGYYSFLITPSISSLALDFSKGYRKFNLAVLLRLGSVYSMRLYILMSGQTRPVTLSIIKIRTMFSLNGKYPHPSDMVSIVIRPAKEELDEKSPISFEYDIVYDKNRIHALVFTPVQKQEEGDLPEEVVQDLHELGFSDQEIKSNLPLLWEASRGIPLHELLVGLRPKLDKYSPANPQGYVIAAIKRALEDSNSPK